MAIGIEAGIWVLFLIDSIIYNFIVHTPTKWHKRTSHWMHKKFPLNKLVGVMYLGLVLWVGFALYRLGLLGFLGF
ncbi:hypothetical protein GF374_00075 [Candidatus Woesearchaeota archaeon]|nr:hypothetical protein [Candidatus Woesearchaeota archaeon]